MRVEDNIDLSRDYHSKAIINTSSTNYKMAIESKKKRISLDSKFMLIDNEISSIKRDISLILNLLREK